MFFRSKTSTQRIGRAETNKTQQKQLAVFDVGETIPRINRRLNADLVILSGAGVEEGGSLNSTTKSLRSRSFRS